MKGTLYALLILLAGYVLAQLVATDSGYILISYDQYVVESTLWSVVLAIFIVLLGLGFISVLVKVLFKSVDFLHPLSGSARRRRAVRKTNKGLIEYVNGQWKAAQRLLSQSAQDGQAPLLNYLAAARAANENGDYESCSDYLRLADKSAPSARAAIGITQAELLLARGQYESALATLKQLLSQSSRHTYVHKLLYKTYFKLHDWKSLVDLLPQLKKLKVLEGRALNRVRRDVYQSLFKQLYKTDQMQHTPELQLRRAEKAWQKLDRTQKVDEVMALAYADCLIHFKVHDQAEVVLRHALTHSYSHVLLESYSCLESSNPERQLQALEKLLGDHLGDTVLLLALGRLCNRLGHEKKAEEYLNASLNQQQTTSAYRELAILMAKRQDYAQSTEFFLNSVNFVTEDD